MWGHSDKGTLGPGTPGPMIIIWLCLIYRNSRTTLAYIMRDSLSKYKALHLIGQSMAGKCS